MACTSDSFSTTKRAQKANYSDSEIRILLDEVMLARGVLFGSFNDQVTMQDKNHAWDRVTSSINACGVAKRSRLEVKEKWKTLKSEVIGRQRRAMKTGGGPPESASPFEDTIMQIIGADSNLYQGVAVTDSASFVRPSVVPIDTEMTHYTNTDAGLFTCTPSQDDFGLEASFSMGQCSRPMSASTPLPDALIPDPIRMSVPFSLPVDGSAAVVVTDLDHGHVNVTADPADPEYRPATACRTAMASRQSRGSLSRRLRQRSTNVTPGDKDERESFIQFLQSASSESQANTKLKLAQYECELVKKDLVTAQHRRELLEIAKLERELGMSE